MCDKVDPLLFYMDRIKHIEYQQIACIGFYFAALAFVFSSGIKGDWSHLLGYVVVLGGLSVVLCHVAVWGVSYSIIARNHERDDFKPISEAMATRSMRKSFSGVACVVLFMTPAILIISACKANNVTYSLAVVGIIAVLMTWYVVILWRPMRDLLQKPKETPPKP